MVDRLHVAPSILALFDQADVRSPGRRRASDGTRASAAHRVQNPTSDHEEGPDGSVDAGDLTDDDANDVDCRQLAAQIVARRDPRVKYLIHEGRMVSSYPTSKYPAWTWRPYSGPNGHFQHLHVSVLPTGRRSTAPWWTPVVRPHSADPTALEESDMPLDRETREYLRAMEDRIKADTQNHIETVLRGPNHPSLTKILDGVAKIRSAVTKEVR